MDPSKPRRRRQLPSPKGMLKANPGAKGSYVGPAIPLAGESKREDFSCFQCFPPNGGFGTFTMEPKKNIQ